VPLSEPHPANGYEATFCHGYTQPTIGGFLNLLTLGIGRLPDVLIRFAGGRLLRLIAAE
jgi:hypothetical protein